MSRLTGSDALGLYEAYQAVYNPQELTEEQVWEEVEEWVNTLIEEGYDLSDYTWEEMFEAYLGEQGGTRGGGERATSQQVGAINRGLSSFGQSIGQSISAANKVPTSSGSRNVRGGGSRPATAVAKPAPSGTNSGQFGRYVPGSQQVKTPTATTPTKLAPVTPATAKPAPTATRPSASSPTPKPAAATAPAAKPSAMDQFAKANPKIAAASAERDRTRGTSATTNPLMKDMKSRLPAPKTPSPTTAKTGFDLAKKGVNLAAGFDMFDVVKGYLIGEGYADTEEAALAIMINMSEEWRQSIVEERAPGVKPYKAGPTQAEVRADAKRASKKKTEKDKDKEGYGPEEKFKDWKLTSTPSTVSKTGETISQRMDKEAPYKTRPFSPLFTKQGSRTASAVTRATEGPGEPQSVTMPRKKSKPSREIVRKNKDTNESYDYILSHLIYEGYANTVESAEKIILNMSEDWILSIIQ
jgi:hypothetical protein